MLTGCRKGAVPAALVRSGPAAARTELVRLQRCFGRDNVAVEIWDHGEPLASARNDALVELACQAGADVVATNNVHYHRPGRARLATAMAAVRGRRSLDDIDGWLPAAASAHLRSGAEQARRFARYPGAVERAAELGSACALRPQIGRPPITPVPHPAGHTEMTWLRHLTEEGARHRYGPREAAKPPPGICPDRLRTGHDRPARFPRLFPHRLGHRPFLQRGRTFIARAGGRRPIPQFAMRSG